MEDLALIKAVNHSGSFGKNFVMFMKKTELLFTGLGRSVLGKTMPSVLSTARGHRLRAVLRTSYIVFPNTDRPRRANNIYMCTWNRTESYWPCEVHVYWSACFFNWKTKIQRITINCQSIASSNVITFYLRIIHLSIECSFWKFNVHKVWGISQLNMLY